MRVTKVSFPVTAEHLLAVGVPVSCAYRFLSPLNLAMIEFSITTGERPAMFLAQVAYESGCFRYMEELWGPTSAQLSYEGRVDLGNTEPGDGFRFRGHGLIQITGRHNHMLEAAYFDENPDTITQWLMSPIGASRSAAHYWASHGCNEAADRFDFVVVTKAINGGLNGLATRTDLYESIARAMQIQML